MAWRVVLHNINIIGPNLTSLDPGTLPCQLFASPISQFGVLVLCSHFPHVAVPSIPIHHHLRPRSRPPFFAFRFSLLRCLCSLVEEQQTRTLSQLWRDRVCSRRISFSESKTHMIEDRHGSRPWQIGAGSSSFAVVSLAIGQSQCCPDEGLINNILPETGHSLSDLLGM